VATPYGFDLRIEEIVNYLQQNANAKIKYIMNDELHLGYDMHFQVTAGETELCFWIHDLKHKSTIKTPRLPLINNIRTGMSEVDFRRAMNFPDTIGNVDEYVFFDERKDGSVTLTFQADTLNVIRTRFRY
jgi:hypothetical protein